MRNLLLAIPALCIIACSSQKETTSTSAKETKLATTYANTITASEMKTDLYIYASDEFEGRFTGKKGQKKLLSI